MPDVVVTPAAAAIALDGSGKPVAGAPAVIPPAAPAATPPGEPNEKPSWLDARLERERRSMLKELGVENVEDAKKSLGELNAKREAEKSAAQKATELAASLKATTAEKESMAEALKGYAKAQLEALTPEQRAAVDAVAGDDPAKQLKAVEALSPTWKSAPTTTTPTTPATPAAPAAPAKAADTAPAGGAPKDTTTSPPDPKAVYAELKKVNPVIAARFAIANGIFDQ